MTANTKPIFTKTPNTGHARLAVANANRDGTGTLVPLWTPGADGGRVESVVVKATGSTTAGMVRLFTDDGGGNIRLLTEVEVAAVTPTAAAPTFEQVVDLSGVVILKNGWSLKAAPHNAEGFDLTAFGGDF